MQDHRTEPSALGSTLSAEQVDCVRRLLFDDIAERAEFLSGSAKDAAERLNNIIPIEDARLSLRLIAESVGVLEQLGWGADGS